MSSLSLQPKEGDRPSWSGCLDLPLATRTGLRGRWGSLVPAHSNQSQVLRQVVHARVCAEAIGCSEAHCLCSGPEEGLFPQQVQNSFPPPRCKKGFHPGLRGLPAGFWELAVCRWSACLYTAGLPVTATTYLSVLCSQSARHGSRCLERDIEQGWHCVLPGNLSSNVSSDVCRPLG